MAEVAEEIVVDAAEEVAEEIEDEPEEEFVAAAGASDVKLFGKWSFDDIEVRDISLEVSFVLLTRRETDGQPGVVALIVVPLWQVLLLVPSL